MSVLITQIELELRFIDYEDKIHNVEIFLDDIEIDFSTSS